MPTERARRILPSIPSWAPCHRPPCETSQYRRTARQVGASWGATVRIGPYGHMNSVTPPTNLRSRHRRDRCRCQPSTSEGRSRHRLRWADCAGRPVEFVVNTMASHEGLGEHPAAGTPRRLRRTLARLAAAGDRSSLPRHHVHRLGRVTVDGLRSGALPDRYASGHETVILAPPSGPCDTFHSPSVARTMAFAIESPRPAPPGAELARWNR
jgi:hypothetical protein